MASNTNVLCLYVCCKHRPLYQNQIFKIPLTFYSAHCRCSVLLWPHCNMSCTSGFVDDVMFSRNDSHKNPFTVLLYTLARYMSSSCVCPSVYHKPVCIKTTKWISWFWYGSFLPLCCKKVRVFPNATICPSATLCQILYLI